ncbi:MAG: ribosome recycling factor, partial [Clostridia bacterium]|nr:ribosome recycling factor [Clostridia bacterium]
MKLDTKDYEAKMKKTIASYTENLSTIRAGRANPDVLKKINVDYYGSPTPINQLAQISTPEARMLVITPWDASSVKD